MATKKRIGKSLKRVQKRRKKSKEPLWKGPEVDGVTQSMINAFLACRERFRLRHIEGLAGVDEFRHTIEYGQMWHVCEETYAACGNPTVELVSAPWVRELQDYCRALCKRYKHQQEQIEHWYQVCLVQFPLYVRYWKKHPDVKQRTPLLAEEVFNVPYELPSGRVVRLRGKWDSVDQVGKGKKALVYLQENKTKGEIVESQIQNQLEFDLQTMIYLIALEVSFETFPPLAGVRYNAVRRPLSGGKGSIRRHKATAKKAEETKEHFYARVRETIEDDPGYFFMRWKVEVSSLDIRRFRQEFLDPILEQMCDWYHWIASPAGVVDPFDDSHHWRTPYGIYSALAKGGSTELDEYLKSGSELGLQRNKPLFTELT